ncbi:MAG: YihY/virulence factor BrkB family protein [Candidatus Dormibacteraceae bacterium]
MDIIRSFMAHRGPQLAILIAWNMLFSLFPIVLAIAAIAGALLGQARISPRQIEEAVLHLLPTSAGSDHFAAALAGAGRHSGLLGVIALFGFLWAASNLFGILEEVFRDIFDLPARKFWQSKLMSLLMMLVFVVLAGLGVIFSTVGESFSHLLTIPITAWESSVLGVGSVLWGVASSILLFGLIYWIVPNRKSRWQEVWPGMLLAGIGFELLSQLFPLYVRLNHGMEQYGSTFAFLFILLTFFYFLGLLTVLGAEVNLAGLRRTEGGAQAEVGEGGKDHGRNAGMEQPAVQRPVG